MMNSADQNLLASSEAKRSQLIWIYMHTVCKGRAYPDSAEPGLEKG